MVVALQLGVRGALLDAVASGGQLVVAMLLDRGDHLSGGVLVDLLPQLRGVSPELFLVLGRGVLMVDLILQLKPLSPGRVDGVRGRYRQAAYQQC